MEVQTLCDLIDERKEELFDLLGRLIRINSENFGSHGNESECPAYIADLCREMGLETDLYSPLSLGGFTEHPDYMEGRHLEDRLNVTAVWRGKEDKNGLMLMGHHDTETVGDPALWTVEPLCGEVRDGKVWGRGACDDKYALAVGLFLLKLLKEQGFEPKENILLTAYCDEEKGGSHGALASTLKYPSRRIVNMDCKNFEIWSAASGGACAKYRFHVAEPLDSCKRTAEALPLVMEVMNRFGRRRKEELDRNPFYAGTIIPGTALRYFGVRAGGNGNDLNIGEIKFSFYTDRTKAQIDAELAAMEAELQEKFTPLGIVSDGFSLTTRYFPYGYTDPDCDAITELQAAAREVSGREVKPCGSCLSDLAVILANGGKDAFSFGVGRDFDEYGGAHQPDEYVDCEELVEFAKIMAAYILRTVG